MSGYTGRNRPSANARTSGVQRSYASQLREHEPLFHSYEHLQGLPRGDTALMLLRKVASLVKPIMRKRGWKVQILAEFLPPEANLLGLNINRGYKICVRLRYQNHPDLFLPVEQVVDTMLHELSHIVWGEHDGNFHKLWDELRDEHDVLVAKGFTGEGFLSEGHRLGGDYVPPPHEMRRLARASAEKRQAQNKLTKGSGQRLGGTPIHLQGGDVRQVIADQISRRNTINKGCGSLRNDAIRWSDQSANNSFRTKAEEDDANDRAIAQALYELMEQEEERKLQGALSSAPTDGGLAWHPVNGLYDPRTEPPPNGFFSEEDQIKWALQESTRSVHPANRPRSAPPIPPASGPQSASAFAPPTSTPPPAVKSLAPRPTSDLPAENTKAIVDLTAGTTPLRSSNPSTANSTPVEPLFDLSEPFDPTARAPSEWVCDVCTCINPLQFLACDACGTERPQPIGIGNRGPGLRRLPAPTPPVPVTIERPATRKRRSTTISTPPQVSTGRRFSISGAINSEKDDQGLRSLGWNCQACGAFMEHKWWTCSVCGKLKESS